MPTVSIDTSEITALVAYVAARQPAGAVVNGLAARLNSVVQVSVKSLAVELFRAGQVDGVIYQSQVTAALAGGLPQAVINKVVTATVGTVTANPPPTTIP